VGLGWPTHVLSAQVWRGGGCGGGGGGVFFLGAARGPQGERGGGCVGVGWGWGGPAQKKGRTVWDGAGGGVGV